MKQLWKKRWVKSIIILCSLLLILFLFRNPILRGLGGYLISEDPLIQTDAYFILGGNSFERGMEAVRIYEQFPSSKFVTTGGNFPLQIQAFDTIMTEAALTRHLMVKKGIPDSLIVILEGSTSTFEESNEIIRYCEEKGYHNITLVSSSFHLRRMRWVFEEKFRIKGITTYFHGAVDSEFDKNNWWKNESSLITCNNEYVKLVYYLFKY